MRISYLSSDVCSSYLHRVIGPHQTVFDRNLSGDEVDQTAVNEVRGTATRPLFVQSDRFAGDAGQAADARTERATGPQPLFLAHFGQDGLFNTQTGGLATVDDDGIDLDLALGIDPPV